MTGTTAVQPPAPDDPHVALAVASRSGFDESVHRGVAVVVDRDGEVMFAAGDPTVPVYPRSAMKPVQAHAMVNAGLVVPPDLLALVCASHDGSPTHVAGVRRILAGAGLDESALRTTPDLPLDRAAAREILRAGGAPAAVTMNCSGKHAGMVATCVAAGWPVDGHLEVGHPLQRHITDTIAAVIGEVVHVGVDGCGAPAHVVPLVDLARGVGRIAAERATVYQAMTAHPEMVGGETRPVTRFMRAAPGLLAKDGAEGTFVAAFPDGRALAVKVADGAQRAVAPVVLSLLGIAGVDRSVSSALAGAVADPIMGHGRPVGAVRSLIGDTGT